MTDEPVGADCPSALPDTAPSAPATKQPYRRDVDGLRAVAVLSVLVYHVKRAVLPGGFVGVDIFFVISGFLITSQNYRELKAGSFSLRKFYQRRINRVVPALLTVVLSCLAVGAFVLSPIDLTRLAMTAVLSLVGASNVYFWREFGNYFHGDMSAAILLHTWSLGVEEQFYMLWPLLLLLLVKWTPRYILPVLIAFTLLALVVSAHWTIALPWAAYYLLPTRLFEFMIGGALAIRAVHGITLTRAQGAFCAALGFALVAYALVMLNDKSPFPGLNALYPCLGAALLILSGSAGHATRLLSTSIMVNLGLISYSLYLWHWPVIAYLTYLEVPAGLVEGTLVVAVSILLAYLSWRFVEQPCRATGSRMAFSSVFLRRFALPAAGVLALAALVFEFHGFPQRFDPMVASFEAMAEAKPNELRGHCHMRNAVYIPDSSYQRDPPPDCQLGTPRETSDGILIGDSFANHYTGMVDVLAKADNIAITDYTADGCVPILGYSPIQVASFARRCIARNIYAFDLLERRKYRYVILAGAWPPDESAEPLLEATIRKVLLTGAQLIIILDLQSIDNPVTCPIRHLIWNKTRGCDAPQSQRLEYWRSIRALFPQVRFVDPTTVICQHNRCNPVSHGILLYRDESHLNDRGSRLIGQLLVASGHTLLR